MANILDYVKKNGDLSFDEFAFNEVDNLIFSTLSYLLFKDFVNESFSNKLSLQTIQDNYDVIVDIKSLAKTLVFMRDNVKLLHMCGSCKRFKRIRVECHVDYADPYEEVQFSAISFIHPSFVYVAYRGTDEELYSWKEDFNIGYMEPVPAQSMALDYLKNVAAHIKNRKIYVGGHSKGGNLAMYAALKVPRDIQDRIEILFNNDGPGFRTRDIWEGNEDFVEKKLVNIRPGSSIFGILMETNGRELVVKSLGRGVDQHSPTNWQVKDADFVYLEKRNQDSLDFEVVFAEWYRNFTNEEKEDFVNKLYEVIISTGATKSTEINPLLVGRLMHSFFNSETETQSVLYERLVGLLVPMVEKNVEKYVGKLINKKGNEDSDLE